MANIIIIRQSRSMATGTSSSSSLPADEEDEILMLYGSESGWVEPKSYCDHLESLSSDLTHIPTPDTPCNRFVLLQPYIFSLQTPRPVHTYYIIWFYRTCCRTRLSSVHLFLFHFVSFFSELVIRSIYVIVL